MTAGLVGPLSVSDLKLYRQCPQKFHNIRRLRLDPGGWHKALAQGTILHKIFEALLSDQPWRPALHEAFPSATARATEKEAEALMREIMWMEASLDHWAPPIGTKVIAVEKEFRTTTPDGIELVGRLDTIVEKTGRLWHLQHKTSGGYTDPVKYSVSKMYDWHEVLYEHMAREAIARGELPDMQWGGTIMHVIKKLTKSELEQAVSPFSFHYNRRDPKIARDALQDIFDTAREAQMSFRPLRDREQCRAFNSLCPFLSVCNGDREMKDMGFTQLELRYA